MMCAVCFIVFLKSCVSCPSRPWPRPWNRTPLWRSWICLTTTSALKGRRLGVWWGWDHDGRTQWRNTEALGKWRKCDDKIWQVLGVFWCIWHVLARSWLKRATIHKSSSSKTGHAHFEILGWATSLGWHPNHSDFLEAEMVYVAGDSPKLCRKIIQVVD